VRSTKIVASTVTNPMVSARLYSEDGEGFQPRMRRERSSFGQDRNQERNTGFGGERGGGDRPRRREPQPISNVIFIRGIPEAKATTQEIGNMVTGLNVISVTPVKNAKGKYTDVVYAEMASSEDAFGALRALRSLSSPTEPLNLRPASPDEREKAIADAAQPQTCVSVRRLAFHASEEEVRNIFAGLDITHISVGNGQALIKFAKPEDAAKAIAEKNNVEVGRRTILVGEALPVEYDFHAARPIRMVRVRGAPPTATEQDFRTFFEGMDVVSVTITTREGISGRTIPGDAFVEFADPSQLASAMKLDRQSMGDRYLQVFRSSPKERRMRLEGPRRPPPQQRDAEEQ